MKLLSLTTECNFYLQRLRRCLVPDSLKPLLLNEICQAHKDKFHMISLICEIYKR